MEKAANVELLIENLVQAAAEYENNCDRLVAKTIRIQLENAKQAIRDAIIPAAVDWAQKLREGTEFAETPFSRAESHVHTPAQKDTP